MARFLTEVAGFTSDAALLGFAGVPYARRARRTALAILQQFVRNQGDAWRWTLDALKREFETLALVAPGRRPIGASTRPSRPTCPIRESSGSARPRCTWPSRRPPPTRPSRPSRSRLADVEEVARDARALADRAFAGLDRPSRPSRLRAGHRRNCASAGRSVYDLIGKLTRNAARPERSRPAYMATTTSGRC